jgi:hypothetical protein
VSKAATPQRDPSILAVLHHAAAEWRVLVANIGRSQPTLVAERVFDSPGSDRIMSFLNDHMVGRVIDVLPSCHVVCRTCTLPNVDLEQLAHAMELQAETFLVGSAPAHRIARAVLPLAPGETTRTALFVGWPEAAEHATPETGRPVTHAPDLVALAALLNGGRPREPMLAVDRMTGSLAVCITHTNGAMFRATRETSSDESDWSRRVGRVIAETALSVGHTGAFVDEIVTSVRHRLDDGASAIALLPTETIKAASQRLGGLETRNQDREWWERWGVAAGVLLAAVHGELAVLTRLEAAPPAEKPSRLRDLATKLSQPHVALVTVAACIVLLMFAPLAVSWLRLTALQLRFPDIGDQKRAVDTANKQVAMYRALEKEAWPMTKLLSDIVSNTPATIQLNVLRVTHADGSFHASGEALPDNSDPAHKLSAEEVIGQMQDNLKATSLFTEINTSWEDKGGFAGTVTFDMSARIVQPYRRVQYPIELDWQKWTLADRQMNKEPGQEPTMLASNAPDDAPESDGLSENVLHPQPGDPHVTPDGPAAETPPRTAPRVAPPPRDRPPISGTGAGRPNDDAQQFTDPTIRGDAPPDSMREPPPFTKAQIDAMSLEEAKKQLSDHAMARQRARSAHNDALEARLKQEFDWLKDHIKKEEERIRKGQK